MVGVEAGGEIVAPHHRIVARRIAGAGAAFQAGDLGLEIRIEEEGQRIAVPARRIDHPVHGRAEAVVGPAHQHVADIDQEHAGPVGRIDPFAVAGLDLKAADIVLRQDGDEAEIAVRRGAELFRVGFGRQRRIVQRPHETHRIAVARGEEAFRQVERGLEQRQEPEAEGRHGVPIPGERVPETVQPARPGIDPVQRPPLHDRGVVLRQLRTDQEGFAEVGPRRIGPVLVGHRHVAAMAHVDPHRQLVGQRLAEKALRRRKGCLNDAL